MSTEANKEVVKRTFTELWMPMGAGLAPELLAPNYVRHWTVGPAGTDMAGIGAVQEAIAGFVAVFPDVQWTVEDLVGEGDRLACRFTGRATRQGEFLGAPADGKRVVIGGSVFYRFSGGKITEDWTQLGVWDLPK